MKKENNKEKFAIALIGAIAEKSAQELYSLCLNSDDQIKMGIKPELTEAKVSEIVLKNCVTFINTIDFNINEYVLDSVDIRASKDAEELVKGHITTFIDSVELLLKKEGSTSMLSVDVEIPIVIDNKIKINNPLLIKCQEFEDSSRGDEIQPESITIIDSNNQRLKFSICDIDIVKSYLKKNHVVDAEEISNLPWYIFDGNVEIDSYSLPMNTIITGDLYIHERLVEIDRDLIVLGKTVANAIAMDGSNDIFLLGGVEFNTALFSMMPGPFRVLRKLKGPLLYTDSDSTLIEGTEDVTCYIDQVYSESHGDVGTLIKNKYLNKSFCSLDSPSLIANAIKYGKNIFNSEDTKEKFITVKEPKLNDREEVITLLKSDGFYLKLLDEKYRADKELIDIAINYSADTFTYIADSLKNDATYIYELVKKEGRVFEFVNSRFKKDKNLVLLAIETTGYALDYAHKSLKADKEVVMAAVRKDPNVLEYADESLKSDEEILLTIINNDVDVFNRYASPSVMDNETIILALIKKAPKYLEAEILKKYRNDKVFIMKALEENHLVFNYLGKNLQKDEDVRKVAGRA